MFTLFKCVSGGISWHEPLIPLQDLGWVCMGPFLVYVSFLYFAVLNVITGVFCENAIENAKNDQDVVIQERIQQRKTYITKLKHLFSEIDDDGSGSITIRELAEFMSNEMSGAFFEYLELDITDSHEILKLFDADGTGEISLDEFIEGCVSMRGASTSLQLAQGNYEIRKHIQSCEYKLMFIEDMMRLLHPEKYEVLSARS